VPEVSNKAMLVMVHQLADPAEHQVTVLNFASDPIVGTINSTHLLSGSVVLDMFTDEVLCEVDDLHSFHITLEGHQGRVPGSYPPQTVPHPRSDADRAS